MKKKLLAMLLALAMVASVAVLPAAAADSCPDHEQEYAQEVYEYIDDEFHDYKVVCAAPDCGRTLFANKMNHVNLNDDGDCTTAAVCKCGYVFTEAKANHNWSSETGKCTNEGCEVTCKHEDETWEMTSQDDKVHYLEKKCNVCHTATQGDAYNHDWSNCDGVCAEPLCGYVCTGTTDADNDHKCDVCGKALTICPNGTDVYYRTIQDDETLALDMKQHFTITACTTCGKDVSTKKEDHTWVNGKCKDCELECEHKDGIRKVSSAYIDPTTKKVDLSKHTVTTVCDVCGETLSVTTGAHKWDNGVCTDCKLVCDHAQNDNCATCTQSAVCSVCGKKDVEKALSHWFSEWKPCSDGFHAAYCIRKGCDWTAGMPCEWHELTFTTSAGEEMTISICPVCGAVRNEDSVFQAIKTATVKMGKSGLPRGELIVRGMEAPNGDCLYALTVGYEYSGWLEKFLGDVTITIPVELEGEFRLVYVDQNLEGQILTDVEYTYEDGKLSFVTKDQGIFLILPVEAE